MPFKHTLLASSISKQIPSASVCLICRFRRSASLILKNTSPSSRSSGSQHVLRQRLYSTASATAINAKKEIPPPFQELHASLSAFKHAASSYVNPDQLRLALQGLESANPVTRVAVFGVNGQQEARRFVWALLADPLCPQSEWEKRLLDGADPDGRSLLLRYGEQLDMDQRHPLIRTLSVPATGLRIHNLEILIKAVTDTSGMSATDSEGEDLLVPSLELDSSTGSIRSGTFPVHRSIIHAKGLQSTSVIPPKSPIKMIKGVVDASWTNLQEDPVSEQVLSPINLTLAESAIQNLRISSERAFQYEHGWFDSGLAGVSAWLFSGSDGKAGGLKPSLRELVETLCNNAERAIAQQEASESQRQARTAISLIIRDSFDRDIARWAELAHTELRDQLDIWFSDRSWKKMAWWQLYWRVDDISSITSDLLQRAWLVEAEKGMVWLFGRLEQAGLKDPENRMRRSAPKLDLPQIRSGAFPGLPLVPGLVPMTAEDYYVADGIAPVEPIVRPWPQEISRARTSLSVITIRPLQALAQRLLLESLSTTVLTASLSGLVYMSLSSPSLYEAGAIAALGFVYSLRRLQGRWGLAKENWEKSIREEGVRLLRHIETEMRRMVKEGGKPIVDEKAEEERREAKISIDKVRKALDGLQ